MLNELCCHKILIFLKYLSLKNYYYFTNALLVDKLLYKLGILS